jgi:hypothetical protein
VTIATFIALLPALLGIAGAEPAEERVRTLVVQDQMLIRVPVRPRQLPTPLQWVERKGPKCIASSAIRGATLSGPEQVDFLLFDRRRVRARLDNNCPALDFYAGFYLNPDDNRICAGRDAIRSRIGGSSMIDRVRELVPRLKR